MVDIRSKPVPKKDMQKREETHENELCSNYPRLCFGASRSTITSCSCGDLLTSKPFRDSAHNLFMDSLQAISPFNTELHCVPIAHVHAHVLPVKYPSFLFSIFFSLPGVGHPLDYQNGCLIIRAETIIQ